MKEFNIKCVAIYDILTFDVSCVVGIYPSIGEFIDWYAKTREAHLKQYLILEVLYKRRIHKTNESIVHCRHKKEYLSFLREKIGRERQKKRITLYSFSNLTY